MSGICSRFKIIFASILISCIVLNLFPLSLLALDESYYSVSDEYNFSITKVVSSRWEDHANIDFTITNNGNATINNWYITTDLPYDVENIWNASIAETSDRYITISSAPQNQPIEPGCSVTFGITGYSEDDTLFDMEPSFYLLNIEDVIIPVEKYQATTNIYSTTEIGFSGAIAITNISSELLTIENVVLNSTNGLIINGNAAIEDETTLVVDSNSRNIYPSASIYINFEGTEEIPEVLDLRYTGLAFTLTEDEDNDGILDIDEFLYPEEELIVTPTPTIAPTNTPEAEEPTPTPEEITPTPVIGTEEVDVVLYVNDFEYRDNLNLYFVNEYYDYFQGTLSGEELVDGFVIIIEDLDGEIIMQRDIEIASEWQILDLELKLGYNKLILIVETAFDTVIRREYELLCTTPDYLQNLGIDTSIDIDNDGMSDYYETEFGLSTETDDTDGDGLPDLFEMTESMTNPLLEDTDNNGVSDYNEDFDSDNLSYEEELLYGTSPIMFDSDFDEISDYDEINIYGTDPTLGDTDNDGLLDSEEVLIGKNPNDSSDGNTLILQTISTEINNAEDSTITSVDITMENSGYLGYSTYSEDLYNIDVYSTEVVGRIGSPIGLNSIIDFDSATVVIHYDDALLGDTNEERLGVLWFDEANGVYIPQNQAIVDSEENTVTIELEHFSTYVLVDLDEWYGAFDNPDVGNRYMIAEDVSGYYASNESLLPTIDEHESNCFAWWKLFHLRLGTFEIVERLRGICYPVSSIEYTFEYTWLVRNIKDSDNDGVCDCYERNGILGTNGHVYNMSSSMIDSDLDGLLDLEELGNIYTLYRGEDGRILVLNNNGEVLFSGEYYIPETSEYYFLRNYLPGTGKCLTICAIKSNPILDDSDGDGVLDANDANPLDVARHSDMFSPCNSIGDAIPNFANYVSDMLPGLNDDFGTRDNSDSEYLSAQGLYYYALTAGTSMFDLLPEASYALTHYLTDDVTSYNFDMCNFILTSNYEKHIMNLFADELYLSPSVFYTALEPYFDHHSVMGTYYYYLYLEYVFEYAKDVLKEGETICICSSNNGNRLIVFETSESTDIQNVTRAAIDFGWMLFLGSGGASGGIVAEITNNDGVYNITYRYAIFDTYDFTEGSTAMILPFASDGDMHELSEFGMAYEFFVYSESCEEYVYYTW